MNPPLSSYYTDLLTALTWATTNQRDLALFSPSGTGRYPDDWYAEVRAVDAYGRSFNGHGYAETAYFAIQAARASLDADIALKPAVPETRGLVEISKPTPSGQALLAQLGLAKPKVQGVVLKGLGT